MNEQRTIDALLSSLEQVGIRHSLSRCRTLVLEELTGVSVTRVHAVGSKEVEGLPAETGRCIGEDPVALCTRPGEWLLVSDTYEPKQLLRLAQDRFASDSVVFTDNSHGLCIFRVTGKGAPWLLGKLSGLDFLCGARRGEHCARTLMQQIAVLVHYRPGDTGAGRFDLMLDRSLASYFWSLLMASTPHADDLAECHGQH